MTAVQHDVAPGARYWPVPLLRAIPTLVMGMVITFSSNHSPRVGLIVFGATSIVGGLVIALGSWRRLDDRSSRILGLVQGVVATVVGVLALAFSTGALPVLVALVIGYALVTGVVESFMGLRRRGRTILSRDWTIVGVLTLVLAVVFLAVPTNIDEKFGGIEKVPGTLTSSVILVGVLGAYGALVGVFLVIQGLSLKWQPAAEPAVDTPIDGAHTS